MVRHYQYLVVGGGVAGGRAVEAIAKRARSVALVGAEPGPPYARPPLSKGVLTGKTPIASLALREPEFYRARGIELFLGDPAVGLDASEQRVRLASGQQLTFGRLLLAPGVHPIQLTVPGAELPGVHYLRTVDDARALRGELGRHRRVVIVGGGFVGCEIAASLTALGIHVSIVEVAGQLMARALGSRVGAILSGRHRAAGVETHLGTRVAALRGRGRVEAVVLDGGRELPCDLVIAGVGAAPELGWLEGSGVDVDDGIVVDEYCRTSRENVFAAGDAARSFSPRLLRHVRVEHEAHAQNQAVVAARNMLGGALAFDPVHYCWSTQHDLDLWILGEGGDGSEVQLAGDEGNWEFLATYHRDGRTVGALGVNRPDQLTPARKLLEDGAAFSAADLAEADVPH